MFVAKNISKTFKRKQKKNFWSKSDIEIKEAVKDVTIEIKPGQIVGLLGVNGAGKTTTIKMLTTMIEPSTGSIEIDGIDSIKQPFEAKKILNLIAGGERSIYWRLTGRENLEYFASLYGLSGNTLKKSIEHNLEIVDLSDSADIPVERYSKGMKQRLQIARGLINDPKYIFLDEPTLGLDVLIAKELREYIKKLAVEENKGILLTTHYMMEADELCDYIYILDNGKIIADGTPERIKQLYSIKQKNQFFFNFLSDEFIDNLNKLTGINHLKVNFELNSIIITSDEDITEQIFSIAKNNKINILQSRFIEPSLEDSLISAIGKEKEYV